jgi:hypothetical protein
MQPLRDPETQQSHPTHGSTERKDFWNLASIAVVCALYVYLAQLRPSGEGWGRGWNMLAFLFYGSPPAVFAGAVALWRAGMSAGAMRRASYIFGALGLCFPVVVIIVMRARA